MEIGCAGWKGHEANPRLMKLFLSSSQSDCIIYILNSSCWDIFPQFLADHTQLLVRIDRYVLKNFSLNAFFCLLPLVFGVWSVGEDASSGSLRPVALLMYCPACSNKC